MTKVTPHIAVAKLQKIVRWCALLLIFGLALNMALFAWKINPDHLQGDQWRWMREVIIPYREGEIGLFKALTYEFAVLSHTHILTMLEMLLNERLFGMNLYVETVIGGLSLFGCFYLLWVHLRKDRQIINLENAPTDVSHDIWVYGLLVVSATAIFSIGVTNAFSWTLVTFEHLYLFMALLMIFKFPELFLKRKIGRLIVLMLFIFLLGDAMGSVAVLTTLIMSIILALADRSYFKPTVLYIGAFVITLTIAHFTLTGYISHSPTSTLDAINYMFTHPGKTFDFIFNGVGRSINSSNQHLQIMGVKVRSSTWYIGLSYDLWKLRRRRLATLAFSGIVLIHFLMTGLVSLHTWDKVLPSNQKYFAKWDAAILEYEPAGDGKVNLLYSKVNPRCLNSYCDRVIDYMRSEGLSTFRTTAPPGKRNSSTK